MEMLACVLALFFGIFPGIAWIFFMEIVHIRKELAETRYFNVTAGINEYALAEIRTGWEE